MTENDKPEQDPNDPWIGQTLGSYTILRRIGEGGMGIVYLARHESLDRLAAVKFLPSTMLDDQAYIELFLREAKAAAKLRHPNIVDVHDAGHLGEDVYYFIMEYVEGESLGSMLDTRGTLPIREAVEYVRQAASALGYAHKKQIIHRDIKPENLLLTGEGLIRVVDLGLAKWTGEESSMLTQSGDILGSPVYISPERLRDPRTSDPKSDIYSLGGTLFHLITGQIPYEGSSPVIMARHLTDPVPNPRDLNPEIDEALAHIIMTMMAKDAEQRYQTMEEVEKALVGYLAGESGPVKAAAVARRKSGKFRWIVIGAVVLAAGAGTYFAMPLLTKSKTQETPSSPVVENPAQPAKPQPIPAAPIATKRIADFNTDSRYNLVKGKFGTWSSASPDPLGRSSETVESGGGHDGSGHWRINFDISNKGSYSGSWMELQDLDHSRYDTLHFMARSADSPALSFIVELKMFPGGHELVRRHALRNIGPEWQSVDIPLLTFNLPPSAALSGINFVFDEPVAGARKGSLWIDDIEFRKMR